MQASLTQCLLRARANTHLPVRLTSFMALPDLASSPTSRIPCPIASSSGFTCAHAWLPAQ